MSHDPLSAIGQVIGDKYIIHGVVGVGGFATVYRATHKIWKQSVAIKFFTELSRLREETRDSLSESFIQEGALLTQLSSQTAAIVQARDVGFHTTADGRWVPYIVMEWLDGQTLEDLCALRTAQGQAAFDLDTALRLLSPVAEALHHAHAHGVVHRDIKPSNIFVVGDPSADAPTVKLLDFGVAKILSARGVQEALTQTGAVSGSFTPHYASPEQFSLRYGATGPHTDIYSLSLVLSEMLSGQPALAGDDVGQLAFSSMDETFRPTPRSLGAKVSDELEAVAAAGLAVYPSQRPASVREYWDELLAAAQSGSPAARGGPSPRGTPVSRPNPRVEVSRPSFSGGTSQPSWPEVRASQAPTKEAPKSAFANQSALPPSSPHTETAAPSSADAAWGAIKKVGGTRGAWGVGVAVVLGGLGFFALLARGGEAESSPAALLEPPEPAIRPQPAAAPVLGCPPEMAFIPAGQYFRGSDERDARPNEKPAHPVQLDAFCIDRTEVTVAAYRACSDAGGCRRAKIEVDWPAIKEEQREIYSTLCNIGMEGRDRHPINCVSWQMADEYCSANEKRLPTEAEWEYATRGPDGRVYPWGDEEPTVEHLNACGAECAQWGKQHGEIMTALYQEDDGYVGTAPVGTFPRGSSRFGLHDVVGNVWEWVADWETTYTAGRLDNPRGATSGTKRTIRGGAFNGGFASWLRPSFRYAQDPTAMSHAIGFRCASALPSSQPPPSTGARQQQGAQASGGNR